MKHSKFEKPRLTLVLAISLLFLCVIVSSCAKDDYADFSNRYIIFENFSDVQFTSLTVPNDTTFSFLVKSQTDRISKPRIYKKIDGGQEILINETDENQILTKIYGSGYREVREVFLDLNEAQYTNASLIEYKVILGIKKGGEMIERLTIQIQ